MNRNFKHAARTALTVATGLILYTTAAHATVMDNVGNYLYGGFTGPLAKGIAVPIFVLSALGMKHAEGRAFQTATVGALSSGGVLAAPLLTTEFKGALGGMLMLLPSLHSLHALVSWF